HPRPSQTGSRCHTPVPRPRQTGAALAPGPSNCACCTPTGARPVLPSSSPPSVLVLDPLDDSLQVVRRPLAEAADGAKRPVPAAPPDRIVQVHASAALDALDGVEPLYVVSANTGRVATGEHHLTPPNHSTARTSTTNSMTRTRPIAAASAPATSLR